VVVVFVVYILNDFCHSNCLNIYRSDLRQIFTVVRPMPVDDQSEISLRSLKDIAMATTFCWFIHRTEFLSFGDIRQMAVAYGKSSARGSLALAQVEVVHGVQWTQAARGVAGWANVRLCLPSSNYSLSANTATVVIYRVD